VPTSHWLQGKYARINLSQAASCKHIQRQNHCFGVFETGYWKDFKKIVSNFKGASSSIEFDFLTKKPKIVKISADVQYMSRSK
jgi:hypothetical protein